MRDVKKKRRTRDKNHIITAIFVFITWALFAGQAMAIDLELFGSPLTIKGFANQSVQFGVAGDKYDTMQGFQQGIMQALLEVEYLPNDNLKLFVTGMLFKDWAYNVYSTDDDWGNDQPPKDPVGRRFKSARNEMSLRTDYEDVLKECHLTWSPPGFNIRVGKQIISWGRMDGVRIMDQINPKDVRLGPSDVEFETSIIPIWLAKMEYYPGYTPPFLDEFGIEFIYNPNADFIGDKAPGPGNYEHGIWAADIPLAPNPLVPTGGQTGKLITNFETPDDWSDGHEYAVRIKGTFPDSTYFTLNFFDGVEENPVYHLDMSRGTFGLNITSLVNDKGLPIVEPYMIGAYEDKRFAGFTFARDFSELYISWLGGVSPLLRMEAIYEFNSVFTFNDESGLVPAYSFEEHDAIYWGFGIDWKFKWNLLNPRRYFSLVPQFSHRRIRDYSCPSGTYLSGAGGSPVSENNYSFSVRMDTWYLHDKLQPFIYYQRDIIQDVRGLHEGSSKSDLWLFRLNYQPNHIWTFKAQLTLMENDGYKIYKGFDHKDNVSFTVQYQF